MSVSIQAGGISASSGKAKVKVTKNNVRISLGAASLNYDPENNRITSQGVGVSAGILTVQLTKNFNEDGTYHHSLDISLKIGNKKLFTKKITAEEGAEAVFEQIRTKGIGIYLDGQTRLDYYTYVNQQTANNQSALTFPEWVNLNSNLDPSGSFGDAKAKESPIAIDLDRDGQIETLSQTENINFDLDDNGFAERTGWIASDDALLVRDLNQDGVIDSGKELFGNNTLLENGQKAANGYEALQELDLNADGVVDQSEVTAADIKLWRDYNSDGITQVGELITLEEAGIESLNTGYTNTNIDDGKGNTIEQTSTATATDGSSIATADVWFGVNLTHTEEVDLLPLSDEILALPNAQAFGNVHSLQQAMARDDVLKSLIADFVALPTSEAREAAMDQIIYQWTGVSEVDPNSYDEFGDVYMDGRQVAALEALVGRKYINNAGANYVQGPYAAGVLTAEYDRFKSYVFSQIVSQVVYSEAFDKIGVDFDVETLTFKPDLTEYKTFLIEQDKGKNSAYVHSSIQALKGIATYSTTLSNSIDQIKTDLVLGDYIPQSFLLGTTGSDSLFGSLHSDGIRGYEGDDFINGGDGADRIRGGVGNDHLEGGKGSDIYYFNRGDGQDVIIDNATSGTDKIVLGEGILREHVSITRSGYDIVLNIADPDGLADDKITLNYQFVSNSGACRIEQVLFSDGTLLEHAEMFREAQNIYGTETSDRLVGSDKTDYLFGYAGDDTLKGGSGSDRIYGGVGNDHLEGGKGSDIYYFNRGDGQDVIIDNATSDTDKIVLGEGILREHVSITRSGYDIVLKIADPDGLADDQITLNYQFVSSSGASRIEQVIFSDGTLLEHAEMFREAQNIYGTEASDRLVGSDKTDYLFGYAGDDTLKGGSGSDRIYGGVGNDHLEGGKGSDIYYFNRGDGQDVIIDNATSGTDKIVLGEGILREHVSITRSGYDIVLNIADPDGLADDKITLNYQFVSSSGASRIEQVLFSDGTLLEHAEMFREAQNMFGSVGNDVLVGSDKTDYLFGYAGDDTLKGGSGSDRIYGGVGNDYLIGGKGSDIYYFNRGDGLDRIKDSSASGTDKIVFGEGILLEDVTITRSGSDIVLSLTDSEGVTVDSLILDSAFISTSGSYRIEEVNFADGSALTHDEMYREAQNVYGTEDDETLTGSTVRDYIYGYGGNDVVQGSSGNDYIYGHEGNDTLKGGSGNDRITGGLGNDRLEGGSGNDIYYFNQGDGQDTIKESSSSSNDQLVLGESISYDDLWFSRSGNDLVIDFNSSTDQVKIQSWYSSSSYEVEQIKASGNVLDHSKVDALVQAMAAFDAPGGAGEEIPQDVKDQLQPVLASSWQPVS
ncbi:calcium-binding protein [Neptuniibacter sp. PT8_73]|uniref:calcium-binding protein n=1 Tax=Neptuniibacter sp. PT8_73 TaxID=3398206 RepID=UPI0039F4AB3C